MSIKPVDIQIFGRLLRVNCPSEQEKELINAANDLNERLQKLKNRTGVSNIEQLAIITALNISYELTQEKTKVFNCIKRIEDCINSLQQRTEKIFSSIDNLKKKNQN